MNKTLKYSLLVLALLSAQIAKTQAPDPGFVEKNALTESGRMLKTAFFKESEGYLQTDLIYQRMEWRVDPAIKYISGKITSYFRANQDELAEIVFDLTDNMPVDSVKQRNHRLAFTRSGNQLFIALKNPLSKGITDSLSVFYRGQPIESGFGSFVTSKHNNIPVMWTLSEPYGAREWWPCKQTLADKIDSIDIIVTSPSAYRAAGNGVLVSEKSEGSKRIMHWKHRYPIATYLVAFAVTNYAEYTDTVKLGDGRMLPILNFVYPETLSAARSQTPRLLEVMQLFNQLFGEYPFLKEKYGHAQCGFGGGMEHQTMTFINYFDFELMTHELAHSWFGNCITLASWHDIWLNEGFATYATGLAYERLFDGRYWKPWKSYTLDNILSTPDGSVYVEDTTSVSRIFSGQLSYNKGAYLLHMLRYKLGDAVFFKAVQNYFSDTAVKFGFAAQHDFIRHLEASSGLSLDEFFKDWYYGEGYPVYSVMYGNISDNICRISLSQVPSHPSVSFFELPVPVRIYSADRQDSSDFRLDHRFNAQVFDVQVSYLVGEMVIDPDMWLVMKVDSLIKRDDWRRDEVFSVSPNPFIKECRIILPPGEKMQAVTFYNMSGRRVYRQEWADFFLKPDISAGTYIVEVTTTTGVYRNKVVKRPE